MVCEGHSFVHLATLMCSDLRKSRKPLKMDKFSTFSTNTLAIKYELYETCILKNQLPYEISYVNTTQQDLTFSRNKLDNDDTFF